MDGATLSSPLTREEPLPRDTSLRDLAAVLFRRLPIILGVILAALAVVVTVNLNSPVVYRSTSRVLVNRGQQESAYTSRQKQLLTWEEELNSEIEAIESGQILEKAQHLVATENVLGTDGKPLELDEKHVTATTTGKSSVIYITYSSTDPKAAVEGCRAVTRAYAEFREQVRAVPEVEKFFREEIEGLREQLEDWEQRRADFMNEESVVRIPEERASLLAVRQEAEIQLNSTRANLAEAEARVEVIRDRLRAAGGDPGVYPFSEAGDGDDQVIVQMKRELIQQRSLLFAARAQFTEEHPDVKSLLERVGSIEKQLRAEMDSYLGHLQGKVEVLKAREEAVLGELQYLDSELAGFPSKEARLASFDRVLEQLRNDYSALVDKQIQARIERTGTSGYNVLVLQPAGKAEGQRVNDYVRLAVIPLLAALFGTALAFVIDGLDHSLKDATDVESHLGVPVLGSVGKLR